MRTLIVCPLIFCIGCISTVDLPLTSQHSLRPRADTDSRIYLQGGVMATPDMTNTLAEVRDARGQIANPTDGSQLFGDSKETWGFLDLGYETDLDLALGLSSAKGIYALYDFWKVNEWAFTVSGSYGSYSEEHSKSDQIVGEAAPVESRYIGHQFTSSVGLQASYAYRYRALTIYPYAVLNLNRTRNSLKLNSDRVHSIQNLPAASLGLYIDLGPCHLVFEQGYVFAYKERGESSRAEHSYANALGLNFSF